MAKHPKKLSQVLTPLQYRKLKEHIPDGDRRKIFSVLIDGLIELLETPQGPFVLGAIISRKLKVSTILDAGIANDGKGNQTSGIEAVD